MAQGPVAQVHAGANGPTLLGPQRRTQWSAAGSVRSREPPGQERRSRVEASRLASVSARLEIASTW